MIRVKRGLVSIAVLGSVLLSCAAWPLAMEAQDMPRNYVMLQGGMSNPLGDFEELRFERGLTLAGFVGRHLHPNFALEIGAHAFHAEGGEADSIIKATFYDRDLITWAVPLTAKAVYTSGRLVLAAGAGVDLLFSTFEYKLRVPGSEDVKEKATAFGFHGQGEVAVELTRMFFLGLQGRYFHAPSAKFGDLPAVNIVAWQLMLTVGLRF